jgi:beta-1,4-mannosyltransferase
VIVAVAPDYRRDNPYQRLLEEYLSDRGVSVVFPDGYRRGLPLFRWVRGLEPRPKVLHLHWIETYLRSRRPFLRALYALKLLVDLLSVRAMGVGLVWTIHNLEAHDSPCAAVDRFAGRCVAALSGRVIVHSRAIESRAARELGLAKGKCVVIPHGHYRDVYGKARERWEARRFLGLDGGSRVFLFFGAVRPYKGVDDLVRVWPRARELAGEAGRDSVLVIAGAATDDYYADRLRKLAECCGNSVRFHLRRIEDEDLPFFFGAADVAVTPFRVVLAMSYGLPVIAPGVEAIREVLGDAADLLYEPGEEGLAAALTRAMTDQLDSLRGKTISVCDRLDWSLIAHQTAITYRGAVA